MFNQRRQETTSEHAGTLRFEVSRFQRNSDYQQNLCYPPERVPSMHLHDHQIVKARWHSPKFLSTSVGEWPPTEERTLSPTKGPWSGKYDGHPVLHAKRDVARDAKVAIRSATARLDFEDQRSRLFLEEPLDGFRRHVPEECE